MLGVAKVVVAVVVAEVVVVVEAEMTTSRLGPGQVVEESQACIYKVVKTHPVLAEIATESGD